MTEENEIIRPSVLATDAIAKGIEDKLNEQVAAKKIVGLAVRVRKYPDPNSQTPEAEIQIKLKKVEGVSLDTDLPAIIEVDFAPANAKGRAAIRPKSFQQALAPDVIEAVAGGLEQFLQVNEYTNADVIVTDYAAAGENVATIEVLGETEAVVLAFGLPVKIKLVLSPVGFE